MISRSYEIRPETLTDSFGGVTSCYDVLSIDLTGQVAMVCVSRLLDNSYDLTIICRKNAADWSIRVPQGQWGNGLSKLLEKLREFQCPEFDIAEPKRRF